MPKEELANKVTKASRKRRLLTGEDVLLTPESIYALQGLGSSSMTQLDAAGMSQSSLPVMESKSIVHRSTFASGHAAGVALRSQLNSFDPFSTFPSMSAEPISKQLLIQYYLQRLAPWFSYLDDEFTPDSTPMAWLPFALHHPALFHASLLTAAVHLNRLQPLNDPSVLLWYKVETMRLANERLNDPSEAATDEMILTVMVLLVFNVSKLAHPT